jgi:hypothetical protein
VLRWLLHLLIVCQALLVLLWCPGLVPSLPHIEVPIGPFAVELACCMVGPLFHSEQIGARSASVVLFAVSEQSDTCPARASTEGVHCKLSS